MLKTVTTTVLVALTLSSSAFAADISTSTSKASYNAAHAVFRTDLTHLSVDHKSVHVDSGITISRGARGDLNEFFDDSIDAIEKEINKSIDKYTQRAPWYKKITNEKVHDISVFSYRERDGLLAFSYKISGKLQNGETATYRFTENVYGIKDRNLFRHTSTKYSDLFNTIERGAQSIFN